MASRPIKISASILIGVPSAGIWQAEMGVCVANMVGLRETAGIAIEVRGAQSCYVEQNRNLLVQVALEGGFGGVLWVDTDMVFPASTLMRLMGHRKHICGANYRERKDPYGYLGFFLDDSDRHCGQGGLHRMERMPGGMMLVKTDVYRKLSYPWYRAPAEPGDPRDDYYFSLKARGAGYEVWCDMDLTRHVVHRGDQEVGWFDKDEPVRRGAEERPGAVERAANAA